MEWEEMQTAIQDAANTIAAPNWADVLGVLLSALAIVAATVVAFQQVRIQKQQNNIALFEKRFHTYVAISRLLMFESLIDEETLESWDHDTMEHFFEVASVCLDFELPSSPDRAIPARLAHSQRMTVSVKQAVFLFPDIREEHVQELCNEFENFWESVTNAVIENPSMDAGEFLRQTSPAFPRVCKQFSERYDQNMMDVLKLSR